MYSQLLNYKITDIMKRIFFLLVLSVMTSLYTRAELIQDPQEQVYHYQLSSHILDIVKGKPASNVKVVLGKMVSGGESWIVLDEKVTDKDGRIADFLKVENGKESSNNGIYRLTFYTKPYFESQNLPTFYPFIEVVFELTGDLHYHVPITLSPYGYSTYRGS